MPELPDVQAYKVYLDSTALHKKIEKTTITDRRILEDTTPQQLARRLKGSELEKTGRRGKYLFVKLEGDGWLVLHFGMTGDLFYYRDEDERPEHARMVLDLANGYHLAYVSQRMLGQVSLTDDIGDFVQGQDLGPDALSEEVDLEAFLEMMKGRRGAVKPTLMNQSIISGIGNVYSDEILFQAGIHPETRVDRLSREDLKRIHRTMRRVLRVVSEKQAKVDRLPRGYLLPCREEGGECPRCGGRIEKKTVSGRSSYFCPRCQPEK